MVTADPTLRSVEFHRLETRYPRTIGRNARLGEHGDGPWADVVVLLTDDGRTGWGLLEGPPGDVDALIGRRLSDLIDPANGVRDPRDHWADVALHDLLGVVLDQPVHALLGGRGTVDVPVYDGYDLPGFLRYLDAVADVSLHWVEEPFLDDADDLAQLRAWLDEHSPATLIAEGETAPDVPTLLPIAAAGSIDVLLMDVISFGLTPWRRLMPEVEAAGTLASPHAWGQPLKTRYAAHLAAGCGNVELVEGVPGTVRGVEDALLRPVDGVLHLDDAPGFGIPLPDAEHLLPHA